MSSKSFFACGKDVSLFAKFLFLVCNILNFIIHFGLWNEKTVQKPEYLRGAPTSTYKSSHDISKLPDEVFEQA